MKNRMRQKEGFALFSVLFIITIISFMLAMLIQISGQRIFTVKRLVDEVKALAYAEAGIEYAYSIVSTDFTQIESNDAFLLASNDSEMQTIVLNSSSDETFSLVMGQLGGDESSAVNRSSYGEGSFGLILTPVGDNYVIIRSIGQCGDATRAAEMVVEDELAGSGGNTPGTDYSNMQGFDYAILCGGTFNFGGCGTVGSSGAKLHSNSSINIKGSANTEVSISSPTTISIGNNKTIKGDVTTPDPDWKSNKVTITGTVKKEAVPVVEIPDIDLTPYYNWAKKNGQVYTGGDSLPTNPQGGVIWVEGDVGLSQGPINGSIIATGNIHISGGGGVNITPPSGFALASRDGDITVTTSGTIKGLIYAKTGSYSQTANGRVEGQLIVNGSIKKGGNSDIIIYKRSVPTDPDPASSSPTLAWPIVSAWQE